MKVFCSYTFYLIILQFYKTHLQLRTYTAFKFSLSQITKEELLDYQLSEITCWGASADCCAFCFYASAVYLYITFIVVKLER